jgi:hypothetical protein
MISGLYPGLLQMIADLCHGLHGHHEWTYHHEWTCRHEWTYHHEWTCRHEWTDRHELIYQNKIIGLKPCKGSTLSIACRSKRQNLPKLGLLLPNDPNVVKSALIYSVVPIHLGQSPRIISYSVTDSLWKAATTYSS